MQRFTRSVSMPLAMQRDVLLNVFECLDLCGLTMASRCCRLWRGVATVHPHLYHTLDFTGFGRFVPDQVLTLYLSRYGAALQQLVLQSTPLTLVHGAHEGAVAMVPRLDTSLSFPSLQVVDATHCPLITSHCAQHLLRVAPRLRQLRLDPHCPLAQEHLTYAPLPDVVGNLLVHECRQGRALATRQLLERGANVHYLAKEAGIAPPVMCKVVLATPLHSAVIAGHEDIVQQLLAFGADPRAVCACDCNICLSQHTTTPLDLAAQFASLYATTQEQRLGILKLLQTADTNAVRDTYPNYPPKGPRLPVAVYCQIAHTLRQMGNAAFAAGDAQRAAHLYTKAIRYLRAARPGLEGDVQLPVRTGLLACLANLAASLLRLGEPSECVAACTELLRLEPGSVKGLYRRGMALARLGCQAEARADLGEARRLAPDAAEVRSALAALGA